MKSSSLSPNLPIGRYQAYVKAWLSTTAVVAELDVYRGFGQLASKNYCKPTVHTVKRHSRGTAPLLKPAFPITRLMYPIRCALTEQVVKS